MHSALAVCLPDNVQNTKLEAKKWIYIQKGSDTREETIKLEVQKKKKNSKKKFIRTEGNFLSEQQYSTVK